MCQAILRYQPKSKDQARDDAGALIFTLRSQREAGQPSHTPSPACLLREWACQRMLACRERVGGLAILRSSRGERGGMTWRQIPSLRVAIINGLGSPPMGSVWAHRAPFSKLSRQALACPSRDTAERIPLWRKRWTGGAGCLACALRRSFGNLCEYGAWGGKAQRLEHGSVFPALGFYLRWFACHRNK